MRDLSNKSVHSLCYAPHTSLYFDVSGNVRVCCHNYSHPAGNILKNSLDEIWNGEKIKILRAALENNDFGPGCDFCRFQTEGGNFSNAAILRFDRFAVSSDHQWPSQMEFSISNSCNLECVMCRGLWSSAIRARREKLPPLPRVYPDTFWSSLRRYLPHLERMRFLGGEPLLIVEYFELWSMMIDGGLATPCHVTTNGTQYNGNVERIMEHIPMSFAVSMDGATKATVESIRVNAIYEEVIANARKFREYTRERKTDFALTYCLMRLNWHEFGDFCELGDDWDCSVAVNTVTSPPEFGIYDLPLAELRKILEAMEKQAIGLESRLKRNKTVWFGELDRVRAKVLAAERSRDAH